MPSPLTSRLTADGWESEDAVEQFGQQLMPAFADVGVDDPPPPTVFPAYKHVS